MKVIMRILTVLVIFLEVIHSYPQEVLATSLSKCVEKVDIVDKDVTKDYGYLKIKVKIPQIVGMKNKSAEDKINNEIRTWAEEWISDGENTAKSFFGKNPELSPEIPYELSNTYKITYKNDKIISMYIDYYQYSGGAHGLTTRKSYNVDLNNGENIALSNLFKVGTDYKTVICGQIKKVVREKQQDFFDTPDKIKCSEDYYLDKDSIIIYYQLYDIAPYVYGIPEFKILYQSFKDNEIKYII